MLHHKKEIEEYLLSLKIAYSIHGNIFSILFRKKGELLRIVLKPDKIMILTTVLYANPSLRNCTTLDETKQAVQKWLNEKFQEALEDL